MQTPSSVDMLHKLATERGTPFKVLIIDDEQWVQEVFRDFCELTRAFDVELADSGRDAIDKVRSNQYDLVTLDLIMPEMSGIDVLSAIKKYSPHVPVIVITGNATDRLVNEAGVMGACRVMYKPVLLEDFVGEVASTLSR